MDEMLLRTKLSAPVLRSDRVHRPRLLDRLSAGLWQENEFQRKLTLISASAGYGKTTLVGDWLRSTNMHSAWLSLDENDNDPARFTGYLVAAFQQVQPDFGADLHPLLRSPQPLPSIVLLTALVNAIARIPQSFILVLDDYHTIHTPAIHHQLGFILDHQPPQMHLAVLTREDPLLPVTRLRAQNQVLELRQADLRFTIDESTEFLKGVMALDLTVKHIRELEQCTEGWIAGLQLAALSLRGVVDKAQFFQEFTGSSRFILDYLMEEVFDRQSPEVQAFLLKTAILERLCCRLCTALTGQSESQATLEYLDQSNLFIVPLDQSRGWFRYHNLFAGLLRHRLQKTDPSGEKDLNQKASLWFQAEGYMNEAIQHALAAQDWVLAASQIGNVAEKMLKGGELTTLHQWYGQLPRDVICAQPGFCLGYIWTLLLSGHYTQAESMLAYIDGIARQVPPLLGQVAVAQAYLARMRGDEKNIVDKSQLALNLLPPDDLVNRSNLLMNLGLVYWHAGKLTEGQNALEEALESARRCGNHFAQLTAEIFLVRTRLARGMLRQAAEDLEQIAQRDVQIPVIAVAHYDLGTLAYECNQLDQAMLHFKTGLAISQSNGNADFEVNGHILLALLHLARGSPAEALAAVEKAHTVARDLSPAVRARCTACHVEVALALGDLASAEQWAGRMEADVSAHPHYRFLGLTRARLYLAKGQKLAASSLLREAYQKAEESGAGYATQVVRILQALAAPGTAEALVYLGEALRQGQYEGYIRSFVDAGSDLVPLLQEAARRGIAPGYAGQILDAFHSKAAVSHPSSMPEPLSERELEVLRLMAEGFSNRQIATRLVISLGTVKSHSHHICAKLEARNRIGAVVRARTLKLL